jgi:hypothetical protein
LTARGQQQAALPTHPVKCATSKLTVNRKGEKILQSALPISFRDSILSPSGLFMIFYDAVGSTSDTDSATAPAYVQRAAEEADSAYNFEVNILGYSPPAFTEGSHNNIYLSPLHIDFVDGQPYGATFPLEGGELPAAPSGVERVRSYCVVDNSFESSVYATHGFDALRITIFHEFFHHIQFSEYGHPPDGTPNYVFFQEMSSVWMEWLSTPTVKDYLNYVASYLTTLDTRFDLSPSEGYGQYIYFAYLTHRFNDTGIVKKIWEFYRDSSNDPITCIDEVLRRNYGSSFCEEYERFGAEVIQTGRRYSGESILPDAQVLPVDTISVMTIAPDSILQLDGVVALSLQFADVGAGQDTCIEVIARDTNRNLQSNCSVEFTAIGAPPTLVLDDTSAYCDTEICILPLSATAPGLEVFPNPFLSNGASQVYIIVSTNNAPPISVVMNILDLNMNEIRSTKTAASPFRGTWNAVWDGRDDNGKLVASGEYLYSLHVDGALKVGKIVVVRK